MATPGQSGGEKKAESTPVPRPSLQTLSDLIFGLALSIGAIGLVARPQTDITNIMVSLSVFAFGFYLLVSVWYRYAAIMKVLPFETTTLVTLNMLLLFLVAIEPYLLNLIISGSQNANLAVLGPISQLYALDFGSIYVVLAYFLHQLSKEEKKLGRAKSVALNRKKMAFFLVVAGVFYLSIAPFFGGIVITYFTLRQLMWIAFLPIGLIFRLTGYLD